MRSNEEMAENLIAPVNPLKALADQMNADFTSIDGVTHQGEEFICVFARGEYLVPLRRFLKRLSKELSK